MKTVLPILVLGAVLASSGNVLAQDKLVKIGVLTDLSGLYSDFTGQGSTLAAEMAIQDSGLNKRVGLSNLSRPTRKTSRTSVQTLHVNGTTSELST